MLPFARSRIKALRDAGQRYAARKFQIPRYPTDQTVSANIDHKGLNYEVTIRIVEDKDYITIEVPPSGNVYFYVRYDSAVSVGNGRYNHTVKGLLFRVDNFQQKKVKLYKSWASEFASSDRVYPYIPGAPLHGVDVPTYIAAYAGKIAALTVAYTPYSSRAEIKHKLSCGTFLSERTEYNPYTVGNWSGGKILNYPFFVGVTTSDGKTGPALHYTTVEDMSVIQYNPAQWVNNAWKGIQLGYDPSAYLTPRRVDFITESLAEQVDSGISPNGGVLPFDSRFVGLSFSPFGSAYTNKQVGFPKQGWNWIQYGDQNGSVVDRQNNFISSFGQVPDSTHADVDAVDPGGFVARNGGYRAFACARDTYVRARDTRGFVPAVWELVHQTPGSFVDGNVLAKVDLRLVKEVISDSTLYRAMCGFYNMSYDFYGGYNGQTLSAANTGWCDANPAQNTMHFTIGLGNDRSNLDPIVTGSVQVIFDQKDLYNSLAVWYSPS